MAGIPVAGDLYMEIDGRLHEIKRQIRQDKYPFDPIALKRHLQSAVDGRFGTSKFGIYFSDRGITYPLLPEVKKFVVKKYFVRNLEKKARVRISYVGDNFSNAFINRVENNVAPRRCGSVSFSNGSSEIELDDVVRDYFGTTDMMLAHIYHFMMIQGHGEKGSLLTNGSANIFIADRDGQLRAIYVLWDNRGWCINAFNPTGTELWGRGRLLFFYMNT